ncbi:MAG TPA: hypothetical protein VN690_08425, partial [Terriglobales bacterium]|nr:hypothetical protein [Terriglobales bacterium]
MPAHRPQARSLATDAEPIRAEIFSPERMASHGASLAAAHTVATTSRPGRPVRPRVIENGRVLHACYRNVALEIQQQRSHSPAA